jgi:uncharacterized protein YktA (UPF0223 family)
MREEKMEQQRLHQEERVRKALERAKAEPKKVVRNFSSCKIYPSLYIGTLCEVKTTMKSVVLITRA